MERADRLLAAPIPGRTYLVPTVRGVWFGGSDFWPVLGPRHTDAEWFNFKEEHYHVDARFLSSRQRAHVGRVSRTNSIEALAQSSPLYNPVGDALVLPSPVLRALRCWRSEFAYQHGHRDPIPALRAHYAGTQCAKGRRGWVCPHQKAALGSINPVDGVITCPLHGLRIDAASGVCLSPEAGAHQ